jgi:lysozyme
MTAVDPRGLQLIREFEGLRLTAYRDPVGILTIGWGHTGADVTEGLTITEAEARTLLATDVARVAAGVDRLVTSPVTAAERAALVSFAFNVGLGALSRSTLLRRVNAGDRAAAAAEFARWVHGTAAGRKVRLAGLVRRRRAEAALFTADPPVEAVPANYSAASTRR